MRTNLERTGGFVHAEAVTVALAGRLGRPAALAAMERICSDAIDRGLGLRDALERARAQDAALAAELPASRLDALFDPLAQRGDADAMIDRTLAAWHAGRVHGAPAPR